VSHFQEINPSSHLQPFVEAFWTFSGNSHPQSYRVLPDTGADLIFDLNQGKAFVSGVMTKFQNRHLATHSNLVGIRFKSENWSFSNTVAPDEIQNARVLFEDLVGSEIKPTLDRLANAQVLKDKLEILEKEVRKQITKNDREQDQLIMAISQEIRNNSGKVAFSQLAKRYQISLRQLERRFKSHVGLTMKCFSSIIRFQRAQKLIRAQTSSSLLKIAFEVGYYDHAHMTKDFVRLSGATPISFR